MLNNPQSYLTIRIDKQHPKRLSFEKKLPWVSFQRMKAALSNLAKDWIDVFKREGDRRKKYYTLKKNIDSDRARKWINGQYPYDGSELTDLGGKTGPRMIPHNLGVSIPIRSIPGIDRIPYYNELERNGSIVKYANITLPFIEENPHHKAKLQNHNNKTFIIHLRPFCYRGPERTREVWEKLVGYAQQLCDFLHDEYGFIVDEPIHHSWEWAVENRYLDDIVKKGYYLIGSDHWVDNTPRTKDNHAKEETHDIEKAQRIGERLEALDSLNQTLQEVRDGLKEVRDGQKETKVEREEDQEILIQLVRGSLDIANLIALQTSSQRTYTEIPKLKSYVGEYRKRMSTVKKAKEDEEQRKWVPHDEVV